MTGKEITKIVYNNIKSKKNDLIESYNDSKESIGFFFIDDLLPKNLALELYKVFPEKSEMRCLKSIREYKYISAQMDKHNSLLEEVLYVFQQKEIIDLIGEICNVKSLYADEFLYAGGISLMSQNNFLNPHLDNSHDAERERWRVLNLLYYVTPNWEIEDGGNLELWPNGPKKNPVVIKSKFNRLVVMATHQSSWHSVNKVLVDKNRCCISNYYFSKEPLKSLDKFHVTKYKGRPEEIFKNLVLDIDANLRMLVRKFFKKGVRKNPHIYKK
ncbi:MAG: 2OG-Fe(II) oxygenase [Algibacter sp.]